MPFLPYFDADESDLRELLMLPGLHQWCYESDRKKTLDYKANVQAFLARYVKGKEIDNEDYMKSWAADVWELRVQLQPKRENTRIWGAFVKPDIFIATHQKLRSSFRRQDDWDAAIQRVIDELAALDRSLHPIKSSPFANCVTFKCTDVNS